MKLDEFRRFRHVVRSRYAHQLDPERVVALAEKLADVSQELIQGCQACCEGEAEKPRREFDASP